MEDSEKVQENRARRKAQRRGLMLYRSRRRDPQALDFGMYMVTDVQTNGLVHSSAPWGGYALTLDQAEELIDEYEVDPSPTSKPRRWRGRAR